MISSEINFDFIGHCKKQIATLDKHCIVYCSTNMSLSRRDDNKIYKKSVYKTYIDKKNKEQEVIGPTYKNITRKKEYDSNKNAVLVYLGKNYDLIGIDIDNKEDTMIRFEEICKKNNFDKKTLTSTTLTGGLHYYFSVSPEQKEKFSNFGTDKGEIIELTSMDGVIFDLHVDVKYTNQLFYEAFAINFENKIHKYEFLNELKPIELPKFIFDEIVRCKMHCNAKETKKENEVKETKKENEVKETKKENEVKETKKENEIKEKIKHKIEQVEIIVLLLNILSSKYYDDRSFWLKIGLILKKYEKETKINMYQYFDDFSKKSQKYNFEEVKKTYDSLNKYDDITLSIYTLYFFAKESDLAAYKEISRNYHKKNNIDITEKYLALKIKELANNLFIYEKGILFCFDKKTNLWYEDTPAILKRFINDELYDFLYILIGDSIEDEKYFANQLKKLRDYCLKNKGQDIIVEEFNKRFFNEDNEDIKFDTKYYLLGFKNGVLDLKTKEFRNYKYDDYMTTQTGYNYKKCSLEERKVIENIINQIEPNNKKKKLLLQILATGLIGQSYHKFVLFNGKGGNGKSLISSFMQIILGLYFYKGSIDTLCEKKNGGANPEIANMNKKRYTLYTEPEERQKIKNGVMKSLTGDKTYNGRALFSNKTDVVLHLTMVLECNTKIQLEGEATEGEIRRMIDYLFSSKFVTDDDLVDEANNIFKANISYCKDEFLEKYKYAFLDILIDAAFDFLGKDKEEFIIPEEVQKRTDEYLQGSMFYLELLKECTENTKDINDFIKIDDLCNIVKTTDYYLTMSKTEKRKITKKSMITFFEDNKFTSKLYKDRHRPIINDAREGHRNVLLGHKFIA
jgi:hypothetical protein